MLAMIDLENTHPWLVVCSQKTASIPEAPQHWHEREWRDLHVRIHQKPSPSLFKNLQDISTELSLGFGLRTKANMFQNL